MSFSKISVIIPSYNQGQYIEQTILSVIEQVYPNIEFIIIDGGSTDNTIAIIEKHQQHIAYWVSESDAGQSDAINKGFAKATGDILCWLNSDDYYLPGALADVNKKLDPQKAQLVFGNAQHFDEATGTTHGSFFDPFKKWDINTGDYLVQPSSFWTRKAFDIAGKLRPDLHFGFDWEWYARAIAKGVEFIPSAYCYSVYRMHADQKSNDNNFTRFKELLSIDRELNPAKFEFIDQYIAKHLSGIEKLYQLTNSCLLSRFEYRLLKLFHPQLLKVMDRITIKKYIDLNFKSPD